MTNAEGSLSEPESGQTADIHVVVDCAEGASRPRWGLMAESFYAELTADLQDVLSVGPMFHVKDDGPESQIPLQVIITLDHAVFGTEPGDGYDPLYHSTSKSSNPVAVSFPAADRARVTWRGTGLSGAGGWDRWIVRLRIADPHGTYYPIHLGFTCLKKEKNLSLRNQLLKAASTAATAAPLAMTADMLKRLTGDPLKLLKLRTRIDLDGGDPLFPELFKPRDEVGLPKHVYLEPLIAIKRTGVGKVFDFEFTSDDPIFLRCAQSDCNPGMPEKDPLALAWMGVTNSKAECMPAEGPVSRGFVTSWIDPGEKVAAVRWREEQKEQGVEDDPQRIASFFFVQRPADNSTRLSGVRSLGALIDPTIVYDKDDPPA